MRLLTVFVQEFVPELVRQVVRESVHEEFQPIRALVADLRRDIRILIENYVGGTLEAINREQIPRVEPVDLEIHVELLVQSPSMRRIRELKAAVDELKAAKAKLETILFCIGVGMAVLVLFGLVRWKGVVLPMAIRVL
ncbi:hypothetical protein F5Y06DRAFT_295810 [Hypoxylon sp. FL0890]|nr:hypothetical protein F5Y06DRAFT_295810 [Hypoxylon sp. FL0890]